MKNRIDVFSGALISAYMLGNGILYLIGFWIFFKVNILQFMEIKDILKSVAIPIITSVSVYLINVIIHHNNIPDDTTRKNFLEEGGILKFFIYLIYTISFVGCVSIVLFIIRDIYFSEPEYKTRGFTALASTVSFMFIAFKTKFLDELGSLRPMVLSAICFIPVACIGKGISDAQDILNGKDTFIVHTNSQCISDSYTKYRFIAAISDKAFALSLKDNSICIFKYDYLKLVKEGINEHTNA